MKQFNNGEWFVIRGRGSVCSINLDQDTYSNEMYQTNVQIEGNKYFVTGLESFGKHREYDKDKGYLYKKEESVGLLVIGVIN
jgi:hypothetical protein